MSKFSFYLHTPRLPFSTHFLPLGLLYSLLLFSYLCFSFFFLCSHFHSFTFFLLHFGVHWNVRVKFSSSLFLLSTLLFLICLSVLIFLRIKIFGVDVSEIREWMEKSQHIDSFVLKRRRYSWERNWLVAHILCGPCFFTGVLLKAEQSITTYRYPA